MRRNCNLELGLFPPYDSGSPKQEERQSQPRQITIFYDGKICVSDVTELQAKSILMLANKKANIIRTPTTVSSSSEPSSSSSPPPPPPLLNSNNQQVYNTTTAGTGLSMKRSLQRFLQKRKNRIQEASPYHHH
ncbi:hypothetical protein HN51_057347 [Arachis hypogaea]|uniref:Protein TIFY n=1 Tax=Arachis hypogaea TaxID=3818 RepID=A0A444WWU2_ARAHY|nr:protein TIFY 5A [Arachis ipaensis]XP_025681548.1 protein TIFY 5A [Arachis hypogaea]QHN80793.1 Protein TIFY 5A [Arachis hypogaea]RYQ81870.1 hypothetical protein Ahy_B10g100470 [Arachis hypogaea]